jgi:hypothetical protein
MEKRERIRSLTSKEWLFAENAEFFHKVLFFLYSTPPGVLVYHYYHFFYKPYILLEV